MIVAQNAPESNSSRKATRPSTENFFSTYGVDRTTGVVMSTEEIGVSLAALVARAAVAVLPGAAA